MNKSAELEMFYRRTVSEAVVQLAHLLKEPNDPA